MPTHARERLLRSAEELFYAEGIRAVGVEQLIAHSGVGRASFYRHFAGKDELAAASVEIRGLRFREALAAEVAARGNHPLDVFDALAAHVRQPGFRGCGAINAMIESADPGSVLFRAAAAHKTALTAWLTGLLADRADPPRLAGQLMLLLDGVVVTALRRDGAAADARTIAVALLAADEETP